MVEKPLNLPANLSVLKMESGSYSETCLCFQNSAWCYSPEDAAWRPLSGKTQVCPCYGAFFTKKWQNFLRGQAMAFHRVAQRGQRRRTADV